MAQIYEPYAHFNSSSYAVRSYCEINDTLQYLFWYWCTSFLVHDTLGLNSSKQTHGKLIGLYKIFPVFYHAKENGKIEKQEYYGMHPWISTITKENSKPKNQERSRK